jgi:C-terminal processing protease CtpA/Prc
VTIARWLTPNGTNVTDTGLNPDVEAVISEDEAQTEVDSQLNKAVEVLNQQ